MVARARSSFASPLIVARSRGTCQSNPMTPQQERA
jgi:hypothetical protein